MKCDLLQYCYNTGPLYHPAPVIIVLLLLHHYLKESNDSSVVLVPPPANQLWWFENEKSPDGFKVTNEYYTDEEVERSQEVVMEWWRDWAQERACQLM